MRLLVGLGALLSIVACGPQRDQSFFRIVQLSAVDKLAVANGFVYYVEAQQLKRVAAKGGGVPEIVSAVGVVDFAAVPGHVYAAAPGGVLHFTVSATGEHALAGDIAGQSVQAVAADANGVSWLSCTVLGHAALDGSDARVVSLVNPCSSGGLKLALDTSTAYGIDAKGEWWASRSGGLPTTFATQTCTHLQAAGGWLYCGGADGLKRVRPFGTPDEDVLKGSVRAFAVGEARVYASLDSNLVSAPRNSSSVDVLGTYAAISAIAVDESGVYFVNTDGDLGLLLRTAP